MLLNELLTKTDKIIKVRINANKRKKNNPVQSSSNPHASDIDVHYGMSGTDRVDGVIQP